MKNDIEKFSTIGLFSALLLMPVTLQAAPLLLTPAERNNVIHSNTVTSQSPDSLYSLNPDTVEQLWQGEINALMLPANGQQIEFREKNRIVREKNVTWHGADASGRITALLTLAKNHVYGQISGEFGTISIAPPAANSTEQAAENSVLPNLINVKLLDPSKEVKIDNGALAPPKESPTDQEQKERSINNADTEDGSRIDVMVLYTNGMAAAHPGDEINTRIQNLIDQGNLSFSNSSINTQFNLVHSEMVNYTDDSTGGMGEALDDLTDNLGVFANVETLRTTYGADQVVLLRRFVDEGCGYAWVLTSARPDLAYAVVHDGDKTDGSGYYCPDLTYVHEIGHNLGCKHDRANAGAGSGRFDYSYGYQSPTQNFRTVMAYDCTNGCPRIPNFSNPNIQYQGEATGVVDTAANSADNAKTINQTRVEMANYRAAVVSGAWTVTPSAGDGGTVNPTAPQKVNDGETAAFTVAANTGFITDPAVGGTCPTGSWNETLYTTGAIAANCSVSFKFVDSNLTWTVTPSAGIGGSISPNTVQTVNTGQTVNFLLTADEGYKIRSVTGCGGTLNRESNTYTTGPVFADCTVTATFKRGAGTINRVIQLLLTD